MIVEFFISLFFTIFKLLFFWLPSIPELDDSIAIGAQTFLDATINVMGFIVYFIGLPLWYAGWSIIVFWLLFDLLVKVFVRFILFIILRRFIGG